MPTPPGTYRPRRDPRYVATVRGGIAEGTGRAEIWQQLLDVGLVADTAHEGRSFDSIYGYYRARARGAKHVSNSSGDAERAVRRRLRLGRRSYTDQECRAAAAYIAEGVVFSVFWQFCGSKWGVPMYRLRNWYNPRRRHFRDLLAVVVEGASAELQRRVAQVMVSAPSGGHTLESFSAAVAACCACVTE